MLNTEIKGINANINPFLIKEEIFQEPLYTDYNIEEDGDNKLKISFSSKSDNKYRLDIFKIIEKDKYDGYINHISFSGYDKNINSNGDYNKLLYKEEMIEIMNRIHYVLKDLLKNNIIDNSFCIGGTELLKKNKIYEYVLKVIVGESGFTKQKTNIYDTKFGLYFSV